jgi:small subunit ribosomal protein S1
MPLKSLRKIKNELISPPKVGEIVEGKVLSRGKSALFLDLGAKGIGIIYGKEFYRAKDTLKNLKIGDTLFAKVINLETEDGYRELSVTEASQELAWEELKTLKESQEVFEVQIKGANKGGLVCEVKGIPAFLPASQLLPEHYPKVEGGERAKIARELQKLVGKKLKVKIFDVDVRQKKLILSEKATKKEKIEQELANYKVGDVVEGEITGVTNFGAFLRFGKELEGLIHASEISEKEEKNPTKVLKVGEIVKAKIIEIANNRVYLSLKNK